MILPPDNDNKTTAQQVVYLLLGTDSTLSAVLHLLFHSDLFQVI